MIHLGLTSDQERAYRVVVVDREENVFLSGGGGVGKSFLIDCITSAMESRGLTVLKAASTNPAALEIGGVTAHRLFQIPLRMAWKTEKAVPARSSSIFDADCIIVDEISMLRIDAFSWMMHEVQCVRDGRPGRKLQVIVVGDFCQLPPVIADATERKLLSEAYGEKFIDGYAFEAPEWKGNHFHLIDLKEVVRQKDARDVAALQRLRFGDHTALKYIKQQSRKRKYSSNDAVSLCGKNKTAKKANDDAMDAIDAEGRTYESEEYGDVKPSDRFAPQSLFLKPGCRVIMLASSDDYVKGDAGTVEKLEGEHVTVRLDSGNVVRVPYLQNDIHGYETHDYVDGSGKNKKKTVLVKVGAYSQIPLIPSYAITIHRSQGQTYDRVNIIIGGKGNGHPEIFATGQFYVAVSRCRSIKNTYIEGDISKIKVLASPEVVKFYEENGVQTTFPSDSEKGTDSEIHEEHRSRQVPKPVKKKAAEHAPEGSTSTNGLLVKVDCPPRASKVIILFAKRLSGDASEVPGGVMVPEKYAGIVRKYASGFHA